MAPEEEIKVKAKSISQMRRTPRGYPVINLAVFDVDDPTTEGYVRDISEKGIQIAGITIRVDQKKTFMVQAENFESVKPFSFDAECRWSRPATDSDPCISGFEIINISEHDLEELQKVVGLLSLMD